MCVYACMHVHGFPFQLRARCINTRARPCVRVCVKFTHQGDIYAVGPCRYVSAHLGIHLPH
jgi:hypothetical protein